MYTWDAKSLYIADVAVKKILKATSRHEFKFSGENDSNNGLIESYEVQKNCPAYYMIFIIYVDLSQNPQKTVTFLKYAVEF